MKLLTNRVFSSHDTGNHPENKKRLEAFGDLPDMEYEADEEILTLVHPKDYVQKIKNSCKTPTILDQDTVVGPGSFQAAVASVALTVAASKNGDFALVRPPGHHAHPTKASGFCLFNNIAIAVQKLVLEGKKVFIFDFDGHLGDGTEAFFYKTNKVLYWSLHQFPAYPGGGSIDQIGDGEGIGYTINVPLPPNSNDEMYLSAVTKLLPIARAFAPDVVAVSAGFDGHMSDPLLKLKLSSLLYWKLGRLLSENFTSIFATLEGGYNLETLPRLVNSFLDGINNAPQPPSETSPEPHFLVLEEFDDQLTKLVQLLHPYWKLP